jgi:hypothetical protein
LVYPEATVLGLRAPRVARLLPIEWEAIVAQGPRIEIRSCAPNVVALPPFIAHWAAPKPILIALRVCPFKWTGAEVFRWWEHRRNGGRSCHTIPDYLLRLDKK